MFNPLISGLRQKHNYEAVLMHMIENIKQSLDEDKTECVVKNNTLRAIDCILCEFSMAKFHANRVFRSAYKLMLSYYCNNAYNRTTIFVNGSLYIRKLHKDQ